MNLYNLILGTKVLEKTHSKYNGEIKVIKDLTWGTRIVVDNLTQSGGIINNIWKETLKKVLEIKPHINNCLILGLGGGTSAKLVAQYWVGAKIVGVDIDKKIVNLGQKYMGLDKMDIDIRIQDAYQFSDGSYDLILVDLYYGKNFPEKFEKEDFFKKIKGLSNKEGIIIFNRLYGGYKRPLAMKFARKLEKVMKKVDYIFPQANVEFICYN